MRARRNTGGINKNKRCSWWHAPPLESAVVSRDIDPDAATRQIDIRQRRHKKKKKTLLVATFMYRAPPHTQTNRIKAILSFTGGARQPCKLHAAGGIRCCQTKGIQYSIYHSVILPNYCRFNRARSRFQTLKRHLFLARSVKTCLGTCMAADK